jgi:hypothetical protein
LVPEATTSTSLIIQATGQKIIVHVSISIVMIETWLANSFNSQKQRPANTNALISK